MTPKLDREYVRRQNRIIALLALVQCWLRQIDGIILDRGTYSTLCGIKAFQDSRVAWILEDFAEFFRRPKIKRENGKRRFQAIYLSNKALKNSDDFGWQSSGEVIEFEGLKIAWLSIWSKYEVYKLSKIKALEPFVSCDDSNHGLLAAYMTLLSQGCIPPDSLLFPEQ